MLNMVNALLDEMLSKLDLREVKDLLPHEQTISYNLKHLKEAMLNIGQLVDPLIVDAKTNLVLDGNHRLKVLQIIECPLAVCQVVDYHSPEIEVGTWYLAINKPLEEIVKKEMVKLEKVDCDVGKDAIVSSKAAFMAVEKKNKQQNACFLEPGSYKLKELIEEQNYILSSMKDVDIRYIQDDQAEEYISKGYTVFYRRIYTKDEIIRAGLEHTPFPPKSTRHLIPNRIIRLNMRLGWLHEDKKGAQQHLVEMLTHRAYNGNVRRYVEPVIVIY